MGRRTAMGVARAYFDLMLDTGDRTAGCWEWPYAKVNKGYGRLGPRQVHRRAFLAEYGRLPHICRHSCDNPSCFNPAHLLDGNHRDNALDASERGQLYGRARGIAPHGERHHWARLSEADVALIVARLAAGEDDGSIGRDFGVTSGAIGDIRRGSNWRHVPRPEMPARQLDPCGTYGAWTRHKKMGERPCDDCVEGFRRYRRERYRRLHG